MCSTWRRVVKWEIGDKAEREKRDFLPRKYSPDMGAAGLFNGINSVNGVPEGPENRKEKLADVGVSTN
jgi:hypothetical protein